MMSKFLDYFRDVKAGGLENPFLIKRSEQSKYWAYLALRKYERFLKAKPMFYSYATGGSLAFLEESLFTVGNRLYFIENASKSMLKSISLAEGCYVVAEVEGGEWQVPGRLTLQETKTFVKILRDLLAINGWTREHSSLNWRMLRDSEEIEVELMSYRDWETV